MASSARLGTCEKHFFMVKRLKLKRFLVPFSSRKAVICPSSLGKLRKKSKDSAGTQTCIVFDDDALAP